MPYVQAIPTWLALNNANFTSPSGMTDADTGYPWPAGGLNLGDYFDITSEQAATVSYLTNGLLYGGRYRLIHVDSGATAANVKTGTIGYLRAGNQLKNVVILTPGSGQTPGTYTVNANVSSGGGSGASIQVVVGPAGTVTSATVLSGGFNYSSLPTFTLVTGGTPGSVVGQLAISMNEITSADQSLITGVGSVRPVIFLNSITPGNYGFVQELGVASVLTGAGAAQAVNQFAIAASGPGTGLLIASNAVASAFAIGQVLDVVAAPLVNTPVKVLLDLPVVQD